MKLNKCKICGTQITDAELNKSLSQKEKEEINKCCKCTCMEAFLSIPI